ncbi:hypothetical protein KPL44_03945 [Clostridium sp. DSM 17811]|uniref:hypothetical protein n=1 Tax=Clostridium sp. DSM 17811 TaxID=2843317 RepID=UPI001C0BB42A|nr:hypothetical protein [Clostridium sp. DSM 17811]MBU3098420.1 hypothetical protein [Clostridium sp. DSM 17811]
MGNQEENDEENDEAIKKQFDKLTKQFKGISGMSASMTPLMGVSSVLAGMQNNVGSQFKDIGRVSAIMSASMTPLMGVSAVLANMQNNVGSQFKDIGRVSAIMSASMTPLMGVSAVLANMQNKWGNQFKDIGRVSALMTSVSCVSTVLADMQNKWSSQFKDIDISNIKINEDGTIFMDDAIDEINDCINSDTPLEEKFIKIYEGIKFQHPLVVFIIVMLLINPLYQCYLDYAKGVIRTSIESVKGKVEIQSNKNKVIKDIKKEVIKQSDINYRHDINAKKALSEYGFVNAESLNIRISNSVNARIIYNLKRVQVVRILNENKNNVKNKYKNKSWTLIEFTDENICVKGWVFTRYLSTFN